MTDSDIRTYRAATIHQALQMVEEELGRDAVILHTRQIEQRRWLPWQTGQEEVEVTAGIGWTVASHSSASAAPPSTQFVVPPDEPSAVESSTISPDGLSTETIPPAGPAAS